MVQSLMLPLLLFLVTVGFGFLVRRSGNPYNPILFNIHKLIALAGVVLATLKVISGLSAGDLAAWTIIAVGAAAGSIILLFASGAVMSIREEGSGLILFFHRVGPVIIMIAFLSMMGIK